MSLLPFLFSSLHSLSLSLSASRRHSITIRRPALGSTGAAPGRRHRRRCAPPPVGAAAKSPPSWPSSYSPSHLPSRASAAELKRARRSAAERHPAVPAALVTSSPLRSRHTAPQDPASKRPQAISGFNHLSAAPALSSPSPADSATDASVPYPVSPNPIKLGGSTSTPPLTFPRHPFELSFPIAPPPR